ncbi:hypothetical protein HMPREF9419_1282 [Prevotella nigrescens ATCC 33563]|nr:hypothetical protein HMPREF9419_1282 [Prevotella nigrescens ATCC 33563]
MRLFGVAKVPVLRGKRACFALQNRLFCIIKQQVLQNTETKTVN